MLTFLKEQTWLYHQSWVFFNEFFPVLSRCKESGSTNLSIKGYTWRRNPTKRHALVVLILSRNSRRGQILLAVLHFNIHWPAAPFVLQSPPLPQGCFLVANVINGLLWSCLWFSSLHGATNVRLPAEHAHIDRVGSPPPCVPLWLEVLSWNISAVINWN